MANPSMTWWQRSSDSDPKKNYIGLRFSVPDLGSPDKPNPTPTTQNDAGLSTPQKEKSAEAKPAPQKEEAKPAQTKNDALDEKVFYGPGESRIVVTPTTISFTGYSTTKKTLYNAELKLAGKVDPKSATCVIKEECPDTTVEVRKEELNAKYWITLTEGKKPNLLTTDFEKWLDEDEQEPENENVETGPSSLDFDFTKQMASMTGMPGTEGIGAGDIEQAQMGDDDSEMPELEGEGEEEEEEAATSTGKPKIEELP
ncbi:hypothetical protein MGYG_00126 [Nannizzia gypsea CBS 118893]|uniref:CS domain-containing protein n=1 Tax=Arthroderma gypseum (strain ATCC MYA-4604 / CBS 118893) TaxID=535722 RepID=E5R354_ARTGP|nr:hypothetical protein MGYG_00126 [Nannizzia gypsea CBS 118893]EFQ97083.1 hypothetical protein MGYG_00126 [Nannizzia gypsea CBS 118893]